MALAFSSSAFKVMERYGYYCCILVAISVNLVAGQSSDSSKILINLTKNRTWLNSELYGEFVNLPPASSLQVEVIASDQNITFIVFQVHSFMYNISLSNGPTSNGSSINGTNLGLYSAVKPAISMFQIDNTNTVKVQIYISIHGYYKNGSPGSQLDDDNCTNNFSYEFYRMYLSERDYSADSYFDGVKKMLTLDSISKQGHLLSPPGPLWSLKRMFSSYPGTGSVYVMVVYSKVGYSVYVPTHTYACSPLKSKDCLLIDDTFSQLSCSGLMFVGLFLCYFAHRFFKTEMYIIGMSTGIIITYIVLSILSDLNTPALIGASIITGIFFGFIWLLFWCFFGMPAFAVMLATLNLGFLVACALYNIMLGEFQILEWNLNFWSAFVFIVCVTSVSMVYVTYAANIISCSVLGAYAVIFSVDFYLGSNLKYIVINAVRRAVTPEFNMAILAPPYQWNDAILTLTWIALTCTGFLLQYYMNKGKPPFPPPPRSVCPMEPLNFATSLNYGTVASNFNSYFSPSPVHQHNAGEERAPLLT